MAYIQLPTPPNTGGLKVDTSELSVSSNTVERQNVCVADPAIAANIATVSAGGTLNTATGGRSTAVVAAGTTTTDVVIKASPGRLCRVLVTALGTAAMTIYDNASTASGVPIAFIPASAAAGSIYDLEMPAANGITAGQVNNSPAITVSYF